MCFLQDYNISNLQVPLSICLFLHFLKLIQEFLPAATPEVIHYVLNPTHLLRLYKLGLEKSPGGDKIIFDFMVKRFDGERGKLLVQSLMLSVIRGREFKIFSVSAITVASDSSSSDLPFVCIREDRIEQAEWI